MAGTKLFSEVTTADFSLPGKCNDSLYYTGTHGKTDECAMRSPVIFHQHNDHRQVHKIRIGFTQEDVITTARVKAKLCYIEGLRCNTARIIINT